MTRYPVQSGIVRGTNPPDYLLTAYGRSVFRLLHVPAERRKGRDVYLRDLPLSIVQLAALWRGEALLAYRAECDRVGIPESERVA